MAYDHIFVVGHVVNAYSSSCELYIRASRSVVLSERFCGSQGAWVHLTTAGLEGSSFLKPSIMTYAPDSARAKSGRGRAAGRGSLRVTQQSLIQQTTNMC